MSHGKLCNLYDFLLPQKVTLTAHFISLLFFSFLYAVVVLRQAISLTQGHEFSLFILHLLIQVILR